LLLVSIENLKKTLNRIKREHQLEKIKSEKNFAFLKETKNTFCSIFVREKSFMLEDRSVLLVNFNKQGVVFGCKVE